ncbi:MAG TPA: hypothetical protein DCP31_20180 [Cyanobacteria bacterium UBA8543]|nr:hypothetical protein [Cyanobacteria bacterium UBA8543]
MNMMKRVSVIALLVTLTSGSLITQAQAQFFPRDDRDRRDDVRDDLEDTLRDIKDDADRFVRSLDRSLDRSRIDGSRREDDLNGIAKELRDQAKRARDRVKSRNLQRGDIQRLLDLGRRMQTAMRNTRRNLSNDARSDWRELSNSLSRLERNNSSFRR